MLSFFFSFDEVDVVVVVVAGVPHAFVVGGGPVLSVSSFLLLNGVVVLELGVPHDAVTGGALSFSFFSVGFVVDLDVFCSTGDNLRLAGLAFPNF